MYRVLKYWSHRSRKLGSQQIADPEVHCCFTKKVGIKKQRYSRITVEKSLYQLKVVNRVVSFCQGCGSGSLLDPDSVKSVDPDPYSESGSGGGQKLPTKVDKNY
jgi:hypothetical protein